MFFDRPDSGELAVLVHLEFTQNADPDDPREFEELVLSAGGDPVAFVTGQRATPNAKYFVGTGKLEELQELVKLHQAELVIFNHTLSPSQERNLEQALECRVLDRTGLILDIFAQRARTFEGKLQVELAQLRHMSTRLIRGWTHLERQKGGIGLRGPGETQLETDRRLLRGRITTIEKRLGKVRRQRDQGRRSRQRASISTVSLVGYTTPASRRCLTILPMPRFTPRINCSRLSTRPCVASSYRMWGRRFWRIPWALSAICRTVWWKLSAQPSRKRPVPICYCM